MIEVLLRKSSRNSLDLERGEDHINENVHETSNTDDYLFGSISLHLESCENKLQDYSIFETIVIFLTILKNARKTISFFVPYQMLKAMFGCGWI